MPEKVPVTGGAFTVPDVLTPEQCAEYIALSEKIGYEAATITTGFGAQLRPDVRNNDRVIYDDEQMAEQLWELIKPYFDMNVGERTAVGLNERLRFYRYDPGQRFNWHMDGYFERDNGERSLYTVLFFLNQDFEGGETSFHVPGEEGYKTIDVKPVTGHVLVFLHEMLHAGSEVIKGRKYILRSDVMYRMPRRR
jgi:predicted 2-oxoglutarate/Fe(II)-dependent dioxygenase YbiX